MTMRTATIGKLVKVNDASARNPGGYGRITARSPKNGLVRVDSSDYPGQEVTGWYRPETLEVLR